MPNKPSKHALSTPAVMTHRLDSVPYLQLEAVLGLGGRGRLTPILLLPRVPWAAQEGH